MATYFIPQTPIQAYVWYQLDTFPPTQLPDDLLLISLAPISPDLAFRRGLPDTAQVTHIIRTATSLAWCDNYEPGSPSLLLPGSVVRCPINSLHYYAVVWAHICGAGFPNEHIRAYALRIATDRVQGKPLFQGYI